MCVWVKQAFVCVSVSVGEASVVCVYAGKASVVCVCV